MQAEPAGYNHGVTLYGGTAWGEPLKAMIRELGWSRYGVNEMHPLVPLDPSDHRDLFEMHHDQGAVFISPYYMSVVPQERVTADNLERFLLAPNNGAGGSDLFWRAIVHLFNT